MAPPHIQFPHVHALPADPQGWYSFGWAITLAGRLAIMRADQDVLGLLEQSRRPDGSWDYYPVPKDTRVKISEFDGEQEQDAVEFPLRHYPHCQFDKLTDGRWVVCERTSPKDLSNGHIIAPDGSETFIELDDDVDQLQADPRGGFWVGYGDIGCLTSSGVASGGIVQFDGGGQPVWAVNKDLEVRLPEVDCAEAMNISQEGAFAYVWPTWAIVSLNGAKTRSLRTRTEFTDAFAISGDLILVAGGFDYSGPGKSERDRIALLGPPPVRGSRRLRRIWTGHFDLPRPPELQLLVGRGNTLHCVTTRTWKHITLAEADSQVEAACRKPPLRSKHASSRQ